MAVIIPNSKFGLNVDVIGPSSQLAAFLNHLTESIHQWSIESLFGPTAHRSILCCDLGVWRHATLEETLCISA